jgi:arginyl-tRNA synthetase
MTLPTRVRHVIQGKLDAISKGTDVRGASWTVERPKRPEHGDYATNVAMALTKTLGKPPRAIAEELVKALEGDAMIAKADIAGPGFVNLRLHPEALHDEVCEILELGRSYGRGPAASGERIDLEFVSANPTGPLLVSHARGAILGDTLGRVLEAAGNVVVREYYVNDFGNQVKLFADSVVAVSQGKPVPEGGYQGEYVKDLAAMLTADQLASEDLARTCSTLMLRGIKKTLASLRVHFDVFFSEESLHRWGAVAIALAELEKTGALTTKDGAVFFTGKGALDDKDRVVKKSDGNYTYFASDIAYHADKLSRGYDRLIDVLGADHHGYVARIRNVLEALGLPSDRFEALLFQLVFVKRGGELVKFSKRAGNIVTADEIISEVDEAAGRAGSGADALRFFYLLRGHTTNVDFDIELAKKKSLDNPVFYVQYGYARLCSILRKADQLGLKASGDLRTLGEPELAIVRKLSDFPGLIVQAAEAREPHRIAFWVQELARDFQSYYTTHKDDPVLGKTDLEKTGARLSWVLAIRNVYASALELCGVSAPDRMEKPAEEPQEE